MKTPSYRLVVDAITQTSKKSIENLRDQRQATTANHFDIAMRRILRLSYKYINLRTVAALATSRLQRPRSMWNRRRGRIHDSTSTADNHRVVVCAHRLQHTIRHHL